MPDVAVSVDTIKRFYLFLAVFYYCGYMGFFTRFVAGKAEGSIESTADGNIIKQALGVAILLIGALLLLYTNREKALFFIKKNMLWLALIAFFIVSISWSDVEAVSIRRLIALLSLIICCLVIAVHFEIRSVLIYFSEVFFYAAILGLVMVVVAPDIALADQSGAGRGNTFFGIYFDKNGGARCYAYALLIRIGLGLINTKTDLFKILTLFVCLVFANSATAIVMLVLGLSVILALNNLHSVNQKSNLKRLLSVMLLALLGSIVINVAYEFILTMLGRDPTLTNRVIIWELLTPYIEDKWLLGYGFGAFWASSSAEDFVDRWGFIGNAHSGYYEAMLNGGIICLAIVVFLIIKIIKDCLVIYVTDKNGTIITPIIAIIVIQTIVNYIGYIVLNFNGADMFLFTTFAFLATHRLYESGSYRLP